MSFLIATLVLMIALFAGALVAPHPDRRIDPCALETGDWSLVDPGCAEMQLTTPLIRPGGTVTAAPGHPNPAWPKVAVTQPRY